jgi:metal-responsive CopG/Arc/MetJ family transcriptional regulator
MVKISKISVSLPAAVLDAVEKERKESGESRSQLIRRSIECLLRERKEKESIKQYIQSYRDNPETKEEILAAHLSAGNILAEEPW